MAKLGKTAVFRTVASPSIGGGHIMRCLTLAKALIAGGWQCHFAVEPGSMEMVPGAPPGLDDNLDLTVRHDAEPNALSARWPDGCDLLVVDHYHRDAAFETACRPWAKCILAIDDLADRRHDADFLLDQNLARRAVDYEPLTTSNCHAMIGPRYALLRPQFAEQREAAIARRAAAKSCDRIFVSLGASDPHDLASLALNALAEVNAQASVDIVLGKAGGNHAALRERAAALPFEVHLHVGIENMAGFLAATDLSIGAVGTTAWERCCLALPTIALITAENQVRAAEALESNGAVLIAGRHDDISASRLASAIAALVHDPNRLSSMSREAAMVCDGRGTSRVIDTIAHHYNE
jgi:UDP-2,4-diacetamido-2,4,6-trideoxy-beta-L-altropyranose hydrolase